MKAPIQEAELAGIEATLRSAVKLSDYAVIGVKLLEQIKWLNDNLQKMTEIAIMRPSVAAYSELEAERDRLQAERDHFIELMQRAVLNASNLEEQRDEARAEVERLRELIDREIMPRYVELFEGSGLGDDASQSVLVQIVRDAINRT